MFTIKSHLAVLIFCNCVYASEAPSVYGVSMGMTYEQLIKGKNFSKLTVFKNPVSTKCEKENIKSYLYKELSTKPFDHGVIIHAAAFDFSSDNKLFKAVFQFYSQDKDLSSEHALLNELFGKPTKMYPYTPNVNNPIAKQQFDATKTDCIANECIVSVWNKMNESDELIFSFTAMNKVTKKSAGRSSLQLMKMSLNDQVGEKISKCNSSSK